MKIEERVQANFSSEQQKVIINLRITSNVIAAHQQQFMDRFDLTMPQFIDLCVLCGSDFCDSIRGQCEQGWRVCACMFSCMCVYLCVYVRACVFVFSKNDTTLGKLTRFAL